MSANLAAIPFQLNDIQIGLHSTSLQLLDHANLEFLADWNNFHKSACKEEDDVQINLELVDQLPPLPEHPPLFQGNNSRLPDGIGTLSVYQDKGGFLLRFLNCGHVHLKPGTTKIEGLVTAEIINYHRLYDLIFTSLSPFLRQRGYYLIHGAAAVHEAQAAIFVGPLSTAKSTTVLNLAFNGWGILSDDTLLLQERPDGIYALPTPGGFSIRPHSVQFIPALAPFVPHPLPTKPFQLSPAKLKLGWANPAPVTAIYFPTAENAEENQYHPLPKAQALAHLLELSLDRWDHLSFASHIAFLEKLTRQAKAASLKITNQQQVPALLLHHS